MGHSAENDAAWYETPGDATYLEPIAEKDAGRTPEEQLLWDIFSNLGARAPQPKELDMSEHAADHDAHWMESAERIYPGEPGSFGYIGECERVLPPGGHDA